MNTLNRYEVMAILELLDAAEREGARIAANDIASVREMWCEQQKLSLKFARQRLLNAALTDVNIEPIAGSAPCDSLHTRASLDKVGEVADPAPGARGKFVPSQPASQSGDAG